MGAVTMRTAIAGLAVGLVLSIVGLGAGVASAQPPAADRLAPPATEPAPAAMPPPPPAAGKLTVEQVLEALKTDRELSDELKRELLKAHANELNEITRKRHDDDSSQIALNKKHVILAYAALWILAVAFLVAQWRRQQALNARIAQLQKELEAANREAKR
jgi:hypothetical protein